MLKPNGINGVGETFWKLTIPDELTNPGVEINIVATRAGLQIGDGQISWGELEQARERIEDARSYPL